MVAAEPDLAERFGADPELVPRFDIGPDPVLRFGAESDLAPCFDAAPDPVPRFDAGTARRVAAPGAEFLQCDGVVLLMV